MQLSTKPSSSQPFIYKKIHSFQTHSTTILEREREREIKLKKKKPYSRLLSPSSSGSTITPMKEVNDHHNQKTSPSSPNMSTSPPRKGSLMSSKVSPPVIDLARCNKHKFWKSVIRAFTRYLTCLKPIPRDDSKESEAVSAYSLQMSPNYYSEMNDEERNDKLKSAIVYCKQTTSTIAVQDKFQQW